MGMFDLKMVVNDEEENGCRFEPMKETWIPTRHAWLIAVREGCWRLNYSLDVIHCYLTGRNYFQSCYVKQFLAWVLPLSLRQRVDDWLHS